MSLQISTPAGCSCGGRVASRLRDNRRYVGDRCQEGRGDYFRVSHGRRFVRSDLKVMGAGLLVVGGGRGVHGVRCSGHPTGGPRPSQRTP